MAYNGFNRVPGEGLEPSLPCGNRILSPARLPIPPPGRVASALAGEGAVYRALTQEGSPDTLSELLPPVEY